MNVHNPLKSKNSPTSTHQSYNWSYPWSTSLRSPTWLRQRETYTRCSLKTVSLLLTSILYCLNSRKSLVARVQILPTELLIEHSSGKEKSLESRRDQVPDFPDDDLRVRDKKYLGSGQLASWIPQVCSGRWNRVETVSRPKVLLGSCPYNIASVVSILHRQSSILAKRRLMQKELASDAHYQHFKQMVDLLIQAWFSIQE